MRLRSLQLTIAPDLDALVPSRGRTRRQTSNRLRRASYPATAASHSLAQEAEELGRLVSRFEVGEGGTVVPMPKRASSPKRAVTALKGVGGRAASALRRPAANVSEEGWEEF